LETIPGSSGGLYVSTATGISMVLGLVGCITFLFKMLISSKDEIIKAKDEQINWFKSQLETAMRTNERAVGASEKLVEKVRSE